MTGTKAASILIVEDERIVAKDLQQTLSGLGYDAFAVASSADEAIAKADERRPDLVLMDIRIKGRRDGIETAAALRDRLDVPVVYLTAHADDATIERAKQSAPYGYLLKPIKAAELRGAIEIALSRHEMERRLRERERWFSTALRSIADAVITVDLAGNVSFVNPVAEALTGVAMADAVGRPVRDVLCLLNDVTQPPLETPLECVLREQRPSELPEATIVSAAGVSRTISDSAAPVVDAGNMLGAVMVFRDITEQKLSQKRLELAERLSSLGAMAAGVAHEINNPLAAAMANTDFAVAELERLRAKTSPPGGAAGELAGFVDEALEAHRESQAALARIRRIVADLKSFSRPPERAGEDADVRRAVAWAVRATAHELRYRASVRVELGELPRVQIEEVRLGQVLVNLLLNAAHAIALGSVETNYVTVEARADGRGRVAISVSDTGAGMSEETLKRAFDPFFTTKAVGVGTGLGLAVCHGIVGSAGGEIAIESAPGRGTTVWVFLPVARAPRADAPTPSPRPGGLRGRILAVDDEPSVLRALTRVLREHDVVGVPDVRSAIRLLERGERFDVILSDVMMPAMTGIEFYDFLLGFDPAIARRVVFMSGGAQIGKVGDFLRTVANPHVEKPFDVPALLDAVERVLSDAHGGGRGPAS